MGMEREIGGIGGVVSHTVHESFFPVRACMEIGKTGSSGGRGGVVSHSP